MNPEKEKITFRMATEIDATYINDLTRRTMIEYVSNAWKDQNEIENYFKKNAFDIAIPTWMICYDKSSLVGALSLKRGKTESGVEILMLDNIHIEPSFHGKGFGTFAVENLVLKVAQKENLPVCLWVLKTNPAKSLYERLGFKVVGERAPRLHMAWNTPEGFQWKGELIQQ